MSDSSTRWMTWPQGLLRNLGVAAVVAATSLMLGCTNPASIDSHIDPNGPQADQDATKSDDEPKELVEFARECTDGRGEPTCFATMDLAGKDLAVLLEQQGYNWSERERMWVKENGSAALAVFDAKAELVDSEGVKALGRGFKESGDCYKIISSGYRSANKAYYELATVVMDEVDSEVTDTSAIGVLANKEKKDERCLVFVTQTNDVYVAYAFSESAVKEGLFDKVAGKEAGKSLEDVFKSVAGRALGSKGDKK